jgi:hypothetical protein
MFQCTDAGCSVLCKTPLTMALEGVVRVETAGRTIQAVQVSMTTSQHKNVQGMPVSEDQASGASGESSIWSDMVHP